MDERNLKLMREAENKPLQKHGISHRAFMVLRGKELGNVFWTTGGEYRTDWYELLFESDDEEAVKKHWHFCYYGRHGG